MIKEPHKFRKKKKKKKKKKKGTMSLVDDLRHLLHNGSAIAASRRGASPVWLEAACFNASDSAIVLRFVNSRAELPFLDVSVDNLTGLVYSAEGYVHPELDTALSRINAKLCGSASVSLMQLAALLAKELGTMSEPAWHGSRGAGATPAKALSYAAVLSSDINSAMRCLAAHPSLSDKQPDEKLLSTLRGLGVHIALLSNALQTLRRHLVCHPVPFAFLAKSAGGGGGGAGILLSSLPGGQQQASLLGSQRDFDAGALMSAIKGIPALPQLLKLVQKPDSLVVLSRESLILLHWLCCMAPVRIVHTGGISGSSSSSHTTVVEGAVADRYAVVHGPPPSDWLCCAHNDTDSTCRSSRGGSACRCDGTGIRLWDCAAAAKHGLLTDSTSVQPGRPLALYHGSASENAYSILCNGLRSLSGTRHEASGSIFGGGAYVTNELAVAQQFAKPTGVMWDGLDCAPARASAAASSSSGSARPGGVNELPPSLVSGSGGGSMRLSSAAHDTCATSAPCKISPIFICQAIAAPDICAYKAGNKVPRTDGGSGGIPSGCYLVVPDPQSHLRVTGLMVLREAAGASGSHLSDASSSNRSTTSDAGSRQDSEATALRHRGPHTAVSSTTYAGASGGGAQVAGGGQRQGDGNHRADHPAGAAATPPPPLLLAVARAVVLALVVIMCAHCCMQQMGIV